VRLASAPSTTSHRPYVYSSEARMPWVRLTHTSDHRNENFEATTGSFIHVNGSTDDYISYGGRPTLPPSYEQSRERSLSEVSHRPELDISTFNSTAVGS
jgi:hypothetical protein